MLKEIKNIQPDGDDESYEMKMGRKARREGKTLDDNPFCIINENWKYAEWEAGWDFQDYESINHKDQ